MTGAAPEHVTRQEFEAWQAAAMRWRRNAIVAYVLVFLAATAGGYLGYRSEQDQQKGFQRNALDTCKQGGLVRIAIAEGFDELRRLAVTGANEKQLRQFVAVTQPAIDRFLTLAAGQPFHVPVTSAPFGEVTGSVETQVKRLSSQRCAAQVESTTS